MLLVKRPDGQALTPEQVTALIAALTRIEATTSCPTYLRTAAAPLLATK